MTPLPLVLSESDLRVYGDAGGYVVASDRFGWLEGCYATPEEAIAAGRSQAQAIRLDLW